MQHWRTFLAGILILVTSLSAAEYVPQEGDLLFQSLPHNEVIDAIEGSTASPYSHCGIVVSTLLGWSVLEAIGPVKQTPLKQWTAQGRERTFAVFRLREEHRPHIPAMIAAARKYSGLPYDIQYELDDKKIYCSELIYKAWLTATGQRMGKLVKLGDLDWKPHEQVIRAIADGLPLERLMITPRDLAQAPQLEAVLPLGAHPILTPKKKR